MQSVIPLLRTLSTALLNTASNKNFNLIHLGGDDRMYLIGENLIQIPVQIKILEKWINLLRNINNSTIIYGGYQ